MSQGVIRIGCAGWALRKEDAKACPPPGSHLERYARRFNAVEINSSFYRLHRRATYERWAASVPDDFRFAVKAPKDITHASRLGASEDALDRFLDEAAGLGRKLGPLLFQLPPSFAFDRVVAHKFFAALRKGFSGRVVCEPRHATWFGKGAAGLFAKFHIARVAVDPAPVPVAADPGGFDDITYFRLHGSPRMYYSAYGAEHVATVAARLQHAARTSREVWCIFDNTAAGAALGDAIELQELCETAAVRS